MTIVVQAAAAIGLLVLAWVLYRWDPAASTAQPRWRSAFGIAAAALLLATAILVGFGRYAFDMTWSEALKAAGAAVLIPASAVVIVAWVRRTTWPAPQEGVEPFALTLVALGTAASQSPDMFVEGLEADLFLGATTALLTSAVVVMAARLPTT